MALPDIDPPLNPWWQQQFGFADFQEFEEATLPFFTNLYQLDPTGVLIDAAQDSAGLFPGSAPGVGVSGWLTRQGYGDSEAGGFMQAVVNTITDALHQPNGEAAPMAQLIIPDCFQVSIEAQSGGQEVINVVGVENAGGNAADAATAVRTAWKIASGPLSLLLTQYALTGFRAVDIGDPNGDIAVITDTTVGTVVGSLATNAACALVKWNGGQRSRSSRGRLYFGPIGEGNINTDGRTLSAGSITAYNTAFTNFRNSLTSSGYPLVVLSRVLAEAFPVTQHSVESVIATQRRRIRG